MKLFVLVGCCVVTFALGAQDRPIFLPEDIEATTLDPECLCKPGVKNKSRSRGLELSYLFVTQSQLEEEEGYPLLDQPSETNLQQFSFKLRAPIVNKPGLKALLGVMYRPEQYDFRRIGGDYRPIFQHLNDRPLKSSGFEAIFSKSWNEKHYAILRTRLLHNGDYGGLFNFESPNRIFNCSAMFGNKKSEEKEWGIGLNLSRSFRGTIVLPFFLYNQTFSDKWGLEMVLPAQANIRYNWSEGSILFAGLRYNSRSYSIRTEEDAPQLFQLNHSELRWTVRLEQRLSSWIWLETALGIQDNFSTDFEGEPSDLTTFQVEQATAPYLKLGLFVSPPDRFLK